MSNTANPRYRRQSLLPEIGADGQARLGRARVLCIGAGGLGCAILPYLAGAGVGHISIIDDDVVELSNLQRQVLFEEKDEGQSKAMTAARRLQGMNSGIDVVALRERLHAGNVQALFEDHDVIVDGSDNFDTKFLAGDAAVKFGVPLVYGSATAFEAQVSVFDPDRGPCLRCLFPAPPQSWVPNCSETGVLGPLVGIAGSVQAAEVIKLLVGDARPSGLEPLIGRLWTMDARDMQGHSLAIRKKPDCPCCQRPPEEIRLARPSKSSSRDITPAELDELSGIQLLDVRETEEWRRGHIPGSINQPLSELVAGRYPSLEENALCVVYCNHGGRGDVAAGLLAGALGVETRNLRGGLDAWPHPLEAQQDEGS